VAAVDTDVRPEGTQTIPRVDHRKSWSTGTLPWSGGFCFWLEAWIAEGYGRPLAHAVYAARRKDRDDEVERNFRTDKPRSIVDADAR
jgi:hypothetical protein